MKAPLYILVTLVYHRIENLSSIFCKNRTNFGEGTMKTKNSNPDSEIAVLSYL